MSTAKFIDLWAPPPGYRVASILATTYHLNADFLEEDLLPVALGLRVPSARGREFRVDLEHALQDVDVTIYLHPDGYQPGYRRSPRIDLIPLPENHTHKLHAKVSLLRFAPEGGGAPANQIVRLVVGSANLTNSGYRNNIEVCVAVDDAPGGDAASATAVRDAQKWLAETVRPSTEQARAQHRYMQAVFEARPTPASRGSMTFVGLPQRGGLANILSAIDAGQIKTLTIASPFWPTGDEPRDVVAKLSDACGGLPGLIRLVGPARSVDGTWCPEMPPALLRAFIEQGSRVEVAYANPSFGCFRDVSSSEEESDEYQKVDNTRSVLLASRPLHAKILHLQGTHADILAMGSFNFTRKGLGITAGASNTEAGMVWKLPKLTAGAIFDFASDWRAVGAQPELLVCSPPLMEGNQEQPWPAFLHAVRASRESITIEGDGASWPAEVRFSMQDIRSRLVSAEFEFDAWTISKPPAGEDVHQTLPLFASWIQNEAYRHLAGYPPLADLEITLKWGQLSAAVPVVFVDKHEFPVVERLHRENERALIDWFLGLRPTGESEWDGFAHGIDAVLAEQPPVAGETTGILSYLVRDFVHALPGVRARLQEGGATEPGLRATLLGPRSPARLAEEILAAWKHPKPGEPRKTDVAAAFQLAELRRLVECTSLPELPDRDTERLRAACLQRIDAVFAQVTSRLGSCVDPALREYLDLSRRAEHATA